jgi:hypothetical protein
LLTLYAAEAADAQTNMQVSVVAMAIASVEVLAVRTRKSATFLEEALKRLIFAARA